MNAKKPFKPTLGKKARRHHVGWLSPKEATAKAIAEKERLAAASVKPAPRIEESKKDEPCHPGAACSRPEQDLGRLSYETMGEVENHAGAVHVVSWDELDSEQRDGWTKFGTMFKEKLT